ncbi:outer membrane beta-barrel protein [Leptobacterium sp. I13]|uniref:outer membrane beta-barrel protein n=1 Tax=Leptobacterium meishanense TaxID=3128904 RepID=UPI0030EB2C53
MGDKKNIDRLFREKFRDFNVSPSDTFWKRIEEKLEKKKSRRIIPIWWKLGGVAALVALLFSIGYNLLINNNDHSPQKNIIVDTQKENEKKTNTDPVTTIPIDSIGNNKNVVSSLTSKENENSKNPLFQKTSSKPNKRAYVTIRDSVSTIQSERSEKLLATIHDRQITHTISDKESKNEKEIAKLSEATLQDTIPDKKAATVVNNTDVKNQKKSLLDIIEEQHKEEETVTAETKNKKWSISPVIAPVYYNTIGEGSPISRQLSDNSKSGNVNLSYGITVTYQLNDRLSIRSGINKVDYGYNTNDVSLRPLAQVETIVNNNTNSFILDDANKTISPIIALETSARPAEITGVLVQEMGYIEVPLELSYRIVDKKLGLNLIGGISSLFLMDNTISIDSDNIDAEIGEANNLNATNFSTNIGLGIDYPLSNKLKINIEPMFKYQLNTFSNSDGGFKPYSLGIYTGFSFRF